MKISEIINGTLLSDASIRVWKNKYYYYSLTAKDKNFLIWVKEIFNKLEIPAYITLNNKVSNVFSLGFYINARPHKELNYLRRKWYVKEANRTKKITPKDLELTSKTLLFWYLGDGSLPRRISDDNRVPSIVLATNSFCKEDIGFLIKKLSKLNLNFSPIMYRSGFIKGKKCGYVLRSNVQDGTPFRFFKLIGLKCPDEIADFTVGCKGRYGKKKYFKDKWPTEEDWIKILSNVKVGKILREGRLELGLTQKQLGNKIGIRRENIRDVELCKRNFSVKNFRKVLKALNIDIFCLLSKL